MVAVFLDLGATVTDEMLIDHQSKIYSDLFKGALHKAEIEQ